MVGALAHVVAHGEGPLVPRPELLAPMLAQFSRIVIGFVVAGLVGTPLRRDELRFSELVAATPAPLGVRLVGAGLAAVPSVTLTYVFPLGGAKLSATLEVDNISDADVQDCFGVQRPGRTFAAKVSVGF